MDVTASNLFPHGDRNSPEYKITLPDGAEASFLCHSLASNMLRWILFLAMAQVPALIAAESPNGSNSSSTTSTNNTRVLATLTSCQLDQPNCACTWVTNAIPPLATGTCLWDAATCQCGWDDGTGNFPRRDLSPTALDKTCVVDGLTCKCLAGYLPLPDAVEATTLSVESLLTSITTQMSEVQSALAQLMPQIRQVVTEPTSAMPALSLEQREKLIEAPLSTMTLLRDVAGNAASFERLELGEKQTLVERLRVEIEYLGKLRGDPEFMAAQLGKMADPGAQPMVERLRGVLAELEEAKRKAGETSA